MSARASSPLALRAARLLGARIQLARRERRWTERELADRLGVTRPTVRKIEQGDLSVRLGSALEAAALLGVPLFDEDEGRRALEEARVRDGLALLPRRVRKPTQFDDDF
jgi:transcriptional regulator with XRE-family HTH domain